MNDLREVHKLWSTPEAQDWHRSIVGRAMLYNGASYKEGGRSYKEIDAVGMITGTCMAIGRTPIVCETPEELVHLLTPIKSPTCGDVVYKAGELLGIIGHERNQVITVDNVLGCLVKQVPIQTKRWWIFNRPKYSEEYEYYCLLKGLWHDVVWNMGTTTDVGRLPASE